MTVSRRAKRRLIGCFAAVALSTLAGGCAIFDIATNEYNSDKLPPALDESFPARNLINTCASPDFYVKAADTRAETIETQISGGETVNFKLLHSVDTDETGFTASAYKQDGGNHVIIVFNGMSKPWKDEVNTPHESPDQMWDDIYTGVESWYGIVNRQMPHLYEFMQAVYEKAGPNSTYETIGYSLGGIHGLHALATLKIPHIGFSPSGLPSHLELYSKEELARVLEGNHSILFSTKYDPNTGIVGPTGPVIIVDAKGDIDSIGPHVIPTGYRQIFEQDPARTCMRPK